MRILQVVDKGPLAGGVAVHVAQLSEALARRGHEVETLRLVDPGHDEDQGNATGPLRLPRSYGIGAGMKLRPRLARVLRERPPDLIHVHECFTTLSPVLVAQMRAAAPVVGTLHDTRPFCYLMTRRFGPTGAVCERRCGSGCFTTGCVRPQDGIDVLRLARRWAVDARSLDEWRRFDRVIVPSAYLRDLALQHGIPAARLRVVPHATRLPAAMPERRDEPPLVVYVGALMRYKGAHLMLEALERIRDTPWQAAFVGDGPERNTLQEAVARAGLGDRVRFEGYIADRASVDATLGRARMLVLPSIVPESFSMVGIEALAAGTPVVTFGLGGIAEWLRPGDNGLVAADGDVADLARGIEALLRDEDLARRMGERGREMVARDFAPQRALDGLLAIYDEAQMSP